MGWFCFSVNAKIQNSSFFVGENIPKPGKGHYSSICHFTYLKKLLLFLTLICAKFIKGDAPRVSLHQEHFKEELVSLESKAWYSHRSPLSQHLTSTRDEVRSCPQRTEQRLQQRQAQYRGFHIRVLPHWGEI